MYKSLKRIVLLLALVCVTLGLSAFALACNPEPEDNGPEISAEYQALYEQYKEAAGENAKTLQDWYDALSADIEEIGDIGDITDMDVLEIEDVKYVALTYENGRLFLEELLNGESFREYSVFTLSPNNAADESTITGIYLDVNRKGANGALEKVRTARTGADGKVSVYLEVDGQATYVVTIGEQSAEAYGFAPGYEPEFSGSQETKTVAFSVQAASQKVTYTAKVVYRADNYAPTKDVKLSLRYVESDAASLKVLGEGTTDDDGKLSISFYAHENSKYEFVLDESSLTPDKYDPVEGPIEVDPEAEETVFTLIRLKNFTDPEILTPTGTATKAEDPEDQEPVALPIPAVTTSSAEWSTLYQYVSDTDTYKYINAQDAANNNKQLYVAMDLFLERVHAEKTIKQLLAEGGFFTYEECVDEDQNTWAEHDYSKVLETYMDSATASGIYPLNNDLRQFIEAAAKNGLFAQKTKDGKYDMFMPLVVYSDPKLIVGKEYTTTLKATNDYRYWGSDVVQNMTVVPLMSNMEEGWYKLKVNSDKFENNKYAHIGGFTWEKSGLFTFGRNFTLTQTSGTTSNVDFEGVIYVGAGAKEICLLTGSYKYNTTYNLKLNLSKITADNGTVAEVDFSALAGKKQQLLWADNNKSNEYDVLVYPESMLENHTQDANRDDKAKLTAYTNISTFGYTFNLDKRMYVDYTVTPTVGDIQGLKIHNFNMIDKKTNNGTQATVNFIYAVTEIKDDVTNCVVHAGDTTQNPWFDGVMFTHSGEGIKTMKIKVDAKFTYFTATYSAGEGVGEDYTERGTGTLDFTNQCRYYSPNSDYTLLDVTNTNLQYSKEGYVFDGWSYEDADGETKTVKAGVKVKMLEHDMVFTAVWREISVNSTEPLTAGGSLKVDIDSGTYTSVEINLAEALEANKGYMLTISTPLENLWTWDIAFGKYTINMFKTETTETDNKYVAYFVNTGEADKLIIDLSRDVGINFKADISLAAYAPATLKADGSEIIVPIYPSALINGSQDEEVLTNVLYSTLDQTMVPAIYRFTKVSSAPVSSVYLKGDLAGDNAGTYGGLTYSGSLSSTSDVTLAEGVTKIHFYGSGLYFGAAKIKIDNLYIVTYRSSQTDVEGKAAPATPATDTSKYTKNAQVTLKTPTLSSTFTNAYVFDYWKKVGDSTDKKYYAGDKFEITENTTFEAVYREVNNMIVNVDLNKQANVEATGDKNLSIDPATYTSCMIKLSNIASMSSYGVILKLDLGSFSFAKEISFSISTTTTYLKFTHSDVLSSDGHNVYSSFYKQDSGTTLDLRLDLSAWAAAENPVINNITVKAVGSSGVSSSGNAKYGVHFEEKEGKLQANGGVNNKGYSNYGFLYGLPNTMMGGHTYKVHVKFNVDDPQKTIGSVTFKDGYISSKAMTYNAESKEYTYDNWSTSQYRYFGLDVSSSTLGKLWYTCDVWLEKTSADPGTTLSLTKTVDSVKITKGAPATVYLDASIAPVYDKSSAETYYIIALEGASDKITLNYREDIKNNSSMSATLDETNRYSAKRITFCSFILTLSTTSETEQTVTVKLSEFKPQDITYDGANEYSLGANKEILDLTSKLGGYADVTITKKDGQPLDDGTVINLKISGTTYTFNKDNNFTQKELSVVTGYYEIWSENGAVEIKISCKKLLTITSVGTAQYSGEFGFNANEDSVEIFKMGTTIKDNTDYFITIVLPAGNEAYEFEISVGETTFTIKASNASTKLKAPQAIQFTEEIRVIKITAKAGITEPVSGIRITLTTT